MHSFWSILVFFCSFFIIICLCTFPFALMLQKQFGFFSKKKTLFFLFIFNLFYLIFWFYLRLNSFEILRLFSYYFGFMALTFSISVVFWISYLVLFGFKKQKFLQKKSVRFIPLGLFFFLSILAIYNFEKPIQLQSFVIKTNKIKQDYKFVHISDMQFGSVSKEYMNNVLEKVKQIKPDFAVFTGDLIDFEGYNQEDFAKFKELDFPIYFERGNHEFYHFPKKILKYLTQIKSIELLINEKTKFNDDLEIVGIDYDDGGKNFFDRLNQIELSPKNYSILLYHAPLFVKQSADFGFDLMLYGHTHGGQIFPATLIVDLIYEYSDGFYKIDDSYAHTTDGASLWGPKMRLGSQNEITIFYLKKED